MVSGLGKGTLPFFAPWLAGLVFALFGSTAVAAQGPGEARLDCSKWSLDGYRVGMRGDEVLEVRSVTLRVEGQAQVIEPGRFHGVLVLDALNRVMKWDAIYDDRAGEALRVEMKTLFH